MPRSSKLSRTTKPAFLRRGCCYTLARVKTLLFLPLAYLAGMDGFAIFAPYLAVMIVLISFFHRPRAAARQRD